MRLTPIWVAVIVVVTPTTLWAQDAEPSASRGRIVFDTTVDIEDGAQAEAEESDFDRAVRARQEQQRATQSRACSTRSDIVQANGALPPRYDENGALIRPAANDCTPAPVAAAPAQQPQRWDLNAIAGTRRDLSFSCAEDRAAARSACDFEPTLPAAIPLDRPTQSREGRVVVENESSGGCTEDRLTGTRTCSSSGSVTIGNHSEGSANTRQIVDDLLDDLQRD